MTLGEAYRVLTTTEYSENISRAEFEKLREATLRFFFERIRDSGKRWAPLESRSCPSCGEPLIHLEFCGVRRWCCETCKDFPVIV